MVLFNHTVCAIIYVVLGLMAIYLFQFINTKTITNTNFPKHL